jgi:hypothetical protein
MHADGALKEWVASLKYAAQESDTDLLKSVIESMDKHSFQRELERYGIRLDSLDSLELTEGSIVVLPKN